MAGEVRDDDAAFWSTLYAVWWAVRLWPGNHEKPLIDHYLKRHPLVVRACLDLLLAQRYIVRHGDGYRVTRRRLRQQLR